MCLRKDGFDDNTDFLEQVFPGPRVVEMVRKVRLSPFSNDLTSFMWPQSSFWSGKEVAPGLHIAAYTSKAQNMPAGPGDLFARDESTSRYQPPLCWQGE